MKKSQNLSFFQFFGSSYSLNAVVGSVPQRFDDLIWEKKSEKIDKKKKSLKNTVRKIFVRGVVQVFYDDVLYIILPTLYNSFIEK